MTSIFWWIGFLETPLRDQNLCWQTPLPPPQLLQHPRGCRQTPEEKQLELVQAVELLAEEVGSQECTSRVCNFLVWCVSLTCFSPQFSWMTIFIPGYLQIIACKIVNFQWNKLPESCQPREWKELGVLKCVACRVNFLLPIVDLRAHDAVNAAEAPFLSFLKASVMASAQICLPQGGEPQRTSTHLQRDVDCSSQGVPCFGSPKQQVLLSCCDSVTSLWEGAEVGFQIIKEGARS